jgi:hypothetical protein
MLMLLPVKLEVVMSQVTLRRSHVVAGAGALVVGALMLGRVGWPAAETRASATAGSNVAVNCEPGQQALVRQTVINGEPQVGVQCAGAAVAAGTVVDEYGRPLTMSGARAMPAAYTPAPYTPAPIARTVAAAPRRTTATARRAAVEPKRSWQQKALVVGGSAGLGAGIGAIVGGKKGAAIGAAIGGGSATLFEAMRKR